MARATVGTEWKCLTSFCRPGEIHPSSWSTRHPSIVSINLSMIIRRLFIIVEWYNPAVTIDQFGIHKFSGPEPQSFVPSKSERSESELRPSIGGVYISLTLTDCLATIRDRTLPHHVAAVATATWVLHKLLVARRCGCCCCCWCCLKVALIKVCVLTVGVWNLLAFYASHSDSESPGHSLILFAFTWPHIQHCPFDSAAPGRIRNDPFSVGPGRSFFYDILNWSAAAAAC